MSRKRHIENQILVTGEQVDLNTPENKVGRNLNLNVMKKLRMNFFFLVFSVFAISVFISCEKAERNFLDDENIKDEIISENTKEAPIPGKIIIRRKHDWGIYINYFDCDPGKGLCVSGDIPPQPIENTYEGILFKHPESENQIIFYFTDEYIEAEDELIVTGKFIIDIDVEIDEEMSNYVGFNNQIRIKAGEYQINKDETGWNVVIADIE